MLRVLWYIFTAAIYISAIAWLIVSKIAEKTIKKGYSFTVDVVIFACFFIITVVTIAILLL